MTQDAGRTSDKKGLWQLVFEPIAFVLSPSFSLVRAGNVVGMLATDNKFGERWKWDNLGHILCFLAIGNVVFFLAFLAMQLNWTRRLIENVSLCGRRPKVAPGKMAPIAEDDSVAVERAQVNKPGSSGEYALAVRHLTKQFGRFVAVDDLSFGVRPRACFGLLGVNGAGKTSTFDVITGRGFASGGAVDINGRSISRGIALGYCPQFDALLPELTSRQSLALLAGMYGIQAPDQKAAALLRCVGMSEHGDKATKNLSGGQKRKISVAVSLLAQNRLIILDEPTAGIHPKARHDIWQLLCGVRDGSETALLLTSHSMDECEALCSRIGILRRGKMAAIGNSQELKSRFGSAYLLSLVLPSPDAVNDADGAVARVFPHATRRAAAGNALAINWQIPRHTEDRWSDLFARAAKAAAAEGATDFCLSQTSLEDAFMRLSGGGEEGGERGGSERDMEGWRP